MIELAAIFSPSFQNSKNFAVYDLFLTVKTNNVAITIDLLLRTFSNTNSPPPYPWKKQEIREKNVLRVINFLGSWTKM